MKQLSNSTVEVITVVPFADLSTTEATLVRDFAGKVFVALPYDQGAALFPVLQNGSLSGSFWEPAGNELLSVIDPKALGIDRAKWSRPSPRSADRHHRMYTLDN